MRRIFTITTTLWLGGCSGEFDPKLGDSMDGTGSPTADDGGSEDDTGDSSGDDGETGSPDDGSSDDGSSDDGSSDDIPESCGDGVADPADECDGFDLRETGCEDLASPGAGAFNGGALSCADDCTFDTSACTYCGDGVKNSPVEECDGDDVGGNTCESEGYDAGEMACDEQCYLDPSECDTCTGPTEGVFGDTTVGCEYAVTTNEYRVCVDSCETVEDCYVEALVICEADFQCVQQQCYLDCSGNLPCPVGMECVSYGVGEITMICMWRRP